MFCNPDADQSPAIVYQYRATPGGEPKTVQRLGNPLVLSFLRTMELVGARQTLTPVTMPSGQQITIEDFPSLAVREAISNAICHRDYHLNGPVVVEHSPEVFIVTSPGPLVSGVTTSNIITTTSRPRNPALAKVARVLGLAEELGRGIDRMYREMIRSGRQLPRIDAEFDRVRVTLVGGAPDTQIARFIASLPQDEREDTDTMLVLYRLCSSKTITAALAAPLLQKTPEEAEAILKRLSSDAIALLERTRATIGRSVPVFRLRVEALKGLGSAVVYQRRTTDEIDRKVIAHVREYGKITNRTLQNFFDVHVFKARDILSDLVHREILVRVSSQQRGTKVEWGPGAKFPVVKSRRSKKVVDEDGAAED
jgi:ATP-dependent DNA helicase RecG